MRRRPTTGPPADQSLTDREAFLRRVTDVAPSILYVYDLVERCTVWSTMGRTAVLGYTAEEIAALGRAVLPTLIHLDDRPRVEAAAAATRAGAPRFDATVRVRQVDGAER